MPLMREWTEITVDEDLLPSVVRELLDMAVNPNQVEVVHATNGRAILAEVHLAEHWYQERLKREEVQDLPLDDFQTMVASEVVAQSNISIENTAQSSSAERIKPEDVAWSNTAQPVVPPVKRGKNHYPPLLLMARNCNGNCLFYPVQDSTSSSDSIELLWPGCYGLVLAGRLERHHLYRDDQELRRPSRVLHQER